MTYSSGGLIQATDYNTFAGNTTAGLNRVWSTGSGDAGWGQTDIATVAASGTVTATQWATIVNNLATTGTQTGTTLTSRTAPVAGNTISILANVSTDITSVTTNRGNAAASGTQSTTWTGNIAKTTGTGSGTNAWTIVWTQTVTFPSANQTRYFWNAGGLVTLDMSFTNNLIDNDPEWNRLVGYVGTLTLAGRVNGAAQTIAAVSYTGFNRSGTGGTQTTLATTTGWYNLTGTPTTMLLLADSTVPYTGDTITVTATATSSTVLTLITTWTSSSRAGAGQATNISGGTDTTSPFTAFGTAPAVLCRFKPPATTYLTNSWGTPAVASSFV